MSAHPADIVRMQDPAGDAIASAREGWALTPDVILFGAAAVLTVAVIAFGVWLFMRAARESDATPPERGGA